MDEKSLELLEFHTAKSRVARFASFELSREAILALTPLTNKRRVEERLLESAEARKLLSLLPGFSVGQVEDIRPAAALAAQGHVLLSTDLLIVAHTLTAVADARQDIEGVREQTPRLWAVAETMSDLRALARELTRGISAAGEILDAASPALADIRRRLIEARRDIVAHLETLMASQKGQSTSSRSEKADTSFPSRQNFGARCRASSTTSRTVARPSSWSRTPQLSRAICSANLKLENEMRFNGFSASAARRSGSTAPR
jgi:dsDNA-specific endonuclease/ATPase MutS2